MVTVANTYLVFTVCQAPTVRKVLTIIHCLTDDETKAKRSDIFSNATELGSSKAEISAHVGERKKLTKVTW